MNYQKYIYIALITLLSCLSGCSVFLKEDPKGYLTEQDFPHTYEGAVSLALAPYENWVNGGFIYGRFFLLWDSGTDDMSPIGRANDPIIRPFVLHNLTSDEQFSYTAVWTPLWKGVADCNRAIDIISRMEVGDITPEQKTEVIGEIRVQRALYYYHLVRMWGDLPFVDRPLNQMNELENDKIERVSALKIYEDLIIPDLEYGYEYCPDFYPSSFAGRMTKTSAAVLLSDVCLTMAGWRYTSQGNLLKGDNAYLKLAEEWALKALNNKGGFDLYTVDDTNQGDAAWLPWRNPFSKESVVEFGNMSGFGTGQQGEGLTVVTDAMFLGGTDFWGINVPQYEGAARGLYIPTPDLWRAFEEGDQRKTHTMLIKTLKANGDSAYSIPLYHKLLDPKIYKGESGFQHSDGDNNIVLYRIADAILNYAEASNEINGPTAEAIFQINRLRTRAGLTALVASDLDQDSFRDAIWQERRVELNGEGKRKFDLIRTNRLKQLADGRDLYYHSSDNPEWKGNGERENILINFVCLPYPQHEYLWPIPRPEMTLHPNWKQNYGY
ncbi:RagB/SusD family nutrient uptake outer membrane protein [Flammeovirga yaeyamensis]|uniref:RagB/SusD family nutrient uptake outer membrane protein n=1 Tax=Flammeovirga yaeyamensis TaxID=367791 RepID=A0AAX1NDC7_9BACT|nr:RagB/SusD family nutrient uptake outer membrane protein [Flammeovirga yaeyamensis]MBB3696516.1 hypothetical protein [Flammeovirga yaeyamensis]NMF33196.1 RagB/SusD family nutrient uptake outer membrane protein [Flammeovirga yaeyamensis]QWG05524.1 RagB/SusD family nutrient uptake outer membrane protein [Flammeovirga yaeyamensis]